MVDLQQKDLRLVIEYAEQLKQPLAGVALPRQLLAALRAEGLTAPRLCSMLSTTGKKIALAIPHLLTQRQPIGPESQRAQE